MNSCRLSECQNSRLDATKNEKNHLKYFRNSRPEATIKSEFVLKPLSLSPTFSDQKTRKAYLGPKSPLSLIFCFLGLFGLRFCTTFVLCVFVHVGLFFKPAQPVCSLNPKSVFRIRRQSFFGASWLQKKGFKEMGLKTTF